MTSEQKAREEIDRLLEAAGWCVQDLRSVDLQAGRGVALRRVPQVPVHAAGLRFRYYRTMAAIVAELIAMSLGES